MSMRRRTSERSCASFTSSQAAGSRQCRAKTCENVATTSLTYRGNAGRPEDPTGRGICLSDGLPPPAACAPRLRMGAPNGGLGRGTEVMPVHDMADPRCAIGGLLEGPGGPCYHRRILWLAQVSAGRGGTRVVRMVTAAALEVHAPAVPPGRGAPAMRCWRAPCATDPAIRMDSRT